MVENSWFSLGILILQFLLLDIVTLEKSSQYLMVVSIIKILFFSYQWFILSFECSSNTHICIAVIFNGFLAGLLRQVLDFSIYWTQEFILVSIMSRSTFINSHKWGIIWDFLTSDAVIFNSSLNVQRLRQVINFSTYLTQ